jgi:hypothetical protein
VLQSNGVAEFFVLDGDEPELRADLMETPASA